MTHHDAVDEWSKVARLFISESGDEMDVMDEATTSLILLKGWRRRFGCDFLRST